MLYAWGLESPSNHHERRPNSRWPGLAIRLTRHASAEVRPWMRQIGIGLQTDPEIP